MVGGRGGRGDLYTGKSSGYVLLDGRAIGYSKPARADESGFNAEGKAVLYGGARVLVLVCGSVCLNSVACTDMRTLQFPC